MLAKVLITDEIPPLKRSDLGVKALNWMEEFKVTHLPIVEGKEYLGLISDHEILDLNDIQSDIGHLGISLIRPFVYETQHIFEVLKTIADFRVSVLPVITENNQYLGVITYKQMIDYLTQLNAVQQPGGVVVLEINAHDYSLSQIAQIVEGNDAKVLSCFLWAHPNSTQIDVVLKINKEDLSAVVQTFHRYNYTVTATFHKSDFDEELKKRYELFMNYIKL
ncbi:MAG: CBS domain-containing protein [Bacteroidetes bacterium]|nr:CBS domain-containing protein [Bacteroidota bacterium]